MENTKPYQLIQEKNIFKILDPSMKLKQELTSIETQSKLVLKLKLAM